MSWSIIFVHMVTGSLIYNVANRRFPRRILHPLLAISTLLQLLKRHQHNSPKMDAILRTSWSIHQRHASTQLQLKTHTEFAFFSFFFFSLLFCS